MRRESGVAGLSGEFINWGKGIEMLDGLFYVLVLLIIIGLAGLAFWITRQSTGFHPAQFLPKKQKKRLTLVETRHLDGKRKLLLVRRDNIEHLVLTGGPVDMVLETGIPVPSHADNGLSYMAAGDGSERTDQSDIALSFSQNGAGASIPAPVPQGFRGGD
jgi:hypothetical protein